MNIPLPGYQPVQAPGPGPQLDPSTAGVPWQAVAQVGHVVQGLGEKGMDIVARVQDAALQKRTADMTLDLNKANAEYQASIITNPGDPSKWSENYEKAIQPLREQWINDKSLSEPQRQHLNLEFNRIAGQASASIIRDSAVATVQNAKTAAGNVISQGEQDGDEATRERGFSLLKPWVSPADYDAARNRSDRNSNLNRIALGIDNDPKAWKDRLEGEDAAKNLGVPVEDLLRLRGRQEEAERRVTFDQIKQAKDEVASNPNLQPEDLERHFGKQLSPSVMATLKEDLAHRDDFALKTLHATPDYQQQTIGQVSAMLDGFKLQDDRYDEKAAQIDSLIRTLPTDSASRATLSDWFDRVKTGQRMEVKTRLDQARKVLVDRYNEGGFGRVDGSGEVTQDVSSLVNAVTQVGAKKQQWQDVQRAFKVRVSEALLSRAIGILERLVRWAEFHGYEFKCPEDRWPLEKRSDQYVKKAVERRTFFIQMPTQRLHIDIREPKNWSKSVGPYPRLIKTPSGKIELSLSLEGRRGGGEEGRRSHLRGR